MLVRELHALLYVGALGEKYKLNLKVLTISGSTSNIKKLHSSTTYVPQFPGDVTKSRPQDLHHWRAIPLPTGLHKP
jgi:hypothetical protein